MARHDDGLDLRGFGCSRWDGEHDSAAFPGDVIAVLDAVAAAGGPDRAVLVGQSIGAAAALRAALGRPDRAAGVVLATRWAGSGTASWPNSSRPTGRPR